MSHLVGSILHGNLSNGSPFNNFWFGIILRLLVLGFLIFMLFKGTTCNNHQCKKPQIEYNNHHKCNKHNHV